MGYILGQPLNVSAAYSGRIACAYKYGKSFTRPTKSDPDSRYVNLCVAIYECESTGGSEWILEDTIHLKNIHLPRIPVDQHLDLSYLYDSRFLQKKQRLTQVLQTLSHEDVRLPRNGENGESTKSNAGKQGYIVSIKSGCKNTFVFPKVYWQFHRLALFSHYENQL